MLFGWPFTAAASMKCLCTDRRAMIGPEYFPPIRGD